MAPLSTYIVNAMYEVSVQTRNLGNNDGSAKAPALTPEQENTLQILALTFATISVASAILAGYWFIKMRRSFRHDLIMLLIQSDMFKALWFMVYPIVVFIRGPVANDSKFCQVNGFFIALGIEASDFAILMIAVHTALYIFRPRTSAGEGGLYPYRHIAYVLWVVFPVLMASLAFINSSDAYISEGTYCYLPVRPFWYRLALSWIPRYIIFIFILAIYASIYYYVRYKFTTFSKDGQIASDPSNNSTEPGSNHRKRPKRDDLPPTPTLNIHGLIPASRQASSSTDPNGRKQSVSTMASFNQEQSGGPHRFIWANLVARTDSPHPPTPPSELSTGDADSFVGPSTPRPLPRYSPSLATPPRAEGSGESSQPSRSRLTSWQDTFVRRFSPAVSYSPTAKPSIVNIHDVLRHHPDSTGMTTPLSQLQLVNSRGQNVAVSEMLRTREKIRKQLRFLFIYPLVYIGMWILPFASHVLQYDDRFAINPPFGLTCVTTVCICMQAAVDCWLFSTREKPWRHIPGSDGSFLGSLKFWSGWKGVSERRVVHGPGKTREEMVREARAAYKRRDQELAQRRSEVDGNGAVGERTGRRTERSWWEVAGVDGAVDSGTMSPVPEEISNPMEEIVASADLDSPNGKRRLKKIETTPSKIDEEEEEEEEEDEDPFRTPSPKEHKKDEMSI